MQSSPSRVEVIKKNCSHVCILLSKINIGKGTWEGLKIPSYVTITLITRAHLSTANKSPYVLVQKKSAKRKYACQSAVYYKEMYCRNLCVGIKTKNFLRWISDYIRMCYIITNTGNKAKLKNPTPNTPPPPSLSNTCA